MLGRMANTRDPYEIWQDGGAFYCSTAEVCNVCVYVCMYAGVCPKSPRQRQDDQHAVWLVFLNVPLYDCMQDGEEVEAEVIPTGTTIDANANDVTTIIRCPVPGDIHTYQQSRKKMKMVVKKEEDMHSYQNKEKTAVGEEQKEEEMIDLMISLVESRKLVDQRQRTDEAGSDHEMMEPSGAEAEAIGRRRRGRRMIVVQEEGEEKGHRRRTLRTADDNAKEEGNYRHDVAAAALEEEEEEEAVEEVKRAKALRQPLQETTKKAVVRIQISKQKRLAGFLNHDR